MGEISAQVRERELGSPISSSIKVSEGHKGVKTNAHKQGGRILYSQKMLDWNVKKGEERQCLSGLKAKKLSPTQILELF